MALQSIIRKGNVMEISGALERESDFLLLLRVIKRHIKHGYKILIVVDAPLKEFHRDLGLACGNKEGFDHMLTEDMLAEKDDTVYEFIGKMILDNYIPDDYYIQSNADKIVYTIKGVSDNES